MPTLRLYQKKLDAAIHDAWAQLLPANPNATVMFVSPTGTGKTVTFSEAIRKEQGAVCAIAHRKEIVAQISLALAKNGIRHRIIGSPKTRKACQRVQLRKLKRHFVDPNARCAVAGIDTLIGIKPGSAEDAWRHTVRLWVGDEGHHFLQSNKWGKGVAMFPHARGLLATATPDRTDGKGLGRHADGFVDALVLGPTMREAIDWGFLVDYRVAMPGSDVDIANVEISKTTGEFNQHQLREAFHTCESICGDVVRAYRKYLDGKRAVVFAVDVEESGKIARQFRDAGIAAESVHGDTDETVRDDILGRFERGEVLVLVNVDLFGEGFDLPNMAGVIFARPTASFSLYCQQWGRGARLDIPDDWMAAWDDYTPEQRRHMIGLSNKPYMWVIDMVGNIMRHNGPPDCRTSWSMDGRAGRGDGGVSITRMCLNKDRHGDGSNIACAKTYERYHKRCPYCQFEPQPAERSTPKAVDGDPLEMDPAALALWRQKIAEIQVPVDAVAHGHDVVAMSIRKNHWNRQQAHQRLTAALKWWGGLMLATGVTCPHEQYRRFYFQFGVDVVTAQTLGAREADELQLKIQNALAPYGIDASVIV